MIFGLSFFYKFALSNLQFSIPLYAGLVFVVYLVVEF